MWYYFINANQFCKCTQLKSYTEIRLKYIREANCQFWLLFCFRVCNALLEAKSIPLKTPLKKHNQAINKFTTANKQFLMSSDSIIK